MCDCHNGIPTLPYLHLIWARVRFEFDYYFKNTHRPVAITINPHIVSFCSSWQLLIANFPIARRRPKQNWNTLSISYDSLLQQWWHSWNWSWARRNRGNRRRLADNHLAQCSRHLVECRRSPSSFHTKCFEQFLLCLNFGKGVSTRTHNSTAPLAMVDVEPASP